MKLASHQVFAIEMGCHIKHEELDEMLRAVGVEPGSEEDICIRMPNHGLLPQPLRGRVLAGLGRI